MIRNLLFILLTFLIITPAHAARGITNERGSNTIETIEGTISTDNSSIAILGTDGVYTGTAEDITNYAIIFINVYSDVASATDGLAIEQSSDGTNWDHDDVYTVPADTGKNYSINPYARYMRVVYTNGAIAQTDFRLQVILKSVNAKPSSHRVQDSITDDDDAELVKSVLSAQIAGDGFVNIGASDTGNLKTTDAENGLAIAKGEVVGTTFVHKFGNAPDFDATDGEVTVWDGAEDGTAWELMEYVYSTSADIDSISSSDGADTAEVNIVGLDANYIPVMQTATLNGQTRVALGTALLRVYRVFNSNSTPFAGHVFVYVNGTLTGGVPNTNADIRAVVQPEHQQTLMAVYTIPAGKTGYMRDWYGATSGANRSSNYPLSLVAREFGGVFRTKHISSISDDGTSSHQHQYQEPEVFQEKTDIEMKVSVSASGTTAAAFSAGFDIVLVDN
jgi:hypothetical protein